ncbi:MAG: hypothetical protein U9R57_07595, partial [Thermodesulfobacteriota bacterium]|nr:hypothetical protein [Thermodesulfobacteriota bacterium]
CFATTTDIASPCCDYNADERQPPGIPLINYYFLLSIMHINTLLWIIKAINKKGAFVEGKVKQEVYLG